MDEKRQEHPKTEPTKLAVLVGTVEDAKTCG
jgi:hypothetical protein